MPGPLHTASSLHTASLSKCLNGQGPEVLLPAHLEVVHIAQTHDLDLLAFFIPNELLQPVLSFQRAPTPPLCLHPEH